MTSEIRYPSQSNEMTFAVWSVDKGKQNYTVTVGDIEGLKRFSEEHWDGEELLINFKDKEITVHDGYMY